MDGEEREVLLHVYDLSGGMAKAMSLALVGKQIDGIWHTGLVLGGREYFFGGGIQVSAAGQTVYGVPVETIKLGTTMIPDELVMDFLEEVSGRYSVETYSLLHNNCNNFSDELATFLTGQGIPARITGLPTEFLATPMGKALAPMLAPMEAQMKAMQGQALFPGKQSSSAPASTAATTLPPAAAGPPPTATPAPLRFRPQPFEYTPVGQMPPLRSITPAAPTKAQAGSAGASGQSDANGARALPKPREDAAKAAAKVKAKEDFEEAVRQEFAKLMSGGDMTANQAAAAALRAAAAAKGKPKA